MSQQNVELLRQALASPPESLFAILDENVEWDTSERSRNQRPTTGRVPFASFFGQWAGAFDDFGFEAKEILDAGDSVAVHLYQWGRGKETGVPVENRTWQLFTFANGKIIRCSGYATKAEALEAAGLSGQGTPKR
jgi:ketosteroid isomerase-like protein